MADLDGFGRLEGPEGQVPGPGSASRPPWRELEGLRPLTLRECRRILVVAPHPRDEIRAAGGLLRRLAARHASVDVLSVTDAPTRTCTPPEGVPMLGTTGTPTATDPVDPALDVVVQPGDLDDPDTLAGVVARLDAAAGEVLAGEVMAEDECEDELQDAEEAGLAEAYRALGIREVRRHRLGLPDGAVARHEADVVGAISEIVGFVDDPGGLCVLAPWSGDGDDDHEAAGRAAEIVCAAYRVRLVRWLDEAWSWAGPESAEVPWRRARQVVLSETAQARKLAASAVFGGRPGRDPERPDGSAPGPREVFLV